jgi:predicted MPP superfamily phosphohydrolase
MAWVEIGPNDGTSFYSFHHPKYFDTVSGIKKISKLHAVTVTGLKPGTTYRYRVFGKELLERNGVDVKFGRTASTDVYTKDPLTFTTFDTQKPETSFIMVNDIHQAKGLMTKLFNYTDYKNKDFVVFNGDMVSWLDARDTLFTGFMNEAIRLFAQEKPIVYTRGNHETRGKCANDLQLYFNPHEPHLYYSFREGPIYFIVLDTGEDKCDDDIEYNGLNDFDTYRTSQAAWISTVADDEDFKTARFHVVICHMPPLIAPDSWHGQRDVMDKFVPELNKLGIDLMLCGHLHEYVYAEPNEQVKFPVLVNSNTGIADVQTKGNALSVTVYDVNGKVTTKKEYKAKEK